MFGEKLPWDFRISPTGAMSALSLNGSVRQLPAVASSLVSGTSVAGQIVQGDVMQQVTVAEQT